MALRAKAIEEKENRFKALLYGGPGVGKSYFACNFPETYYIDTENLDEYKQFRELLKSNNSSLITLHELSDIVHEVQSLMTTKHNFKTLVIDSLTNVFEEMGFNEADRLSKGGTIDGTEFQRHLNKPKRMLAHLCNMIRRLDMNVILTSQEKPEYLNVNGKTEQVGITQDIPKSVAHAIGTRLHVTMSGQKSMAKFTKTRYEEFKTNEFMELSYHEIEKRLGRDMFVKEVKHVEIATPDQVKMLKELIKIVNVSEATIATALTRSGSSCFEDMPADKIKIWISSLHKKLPEGVQIIQGFVNRTLLENLPDCIGREELTSSYNKQRDDECRADDHD